MVRGITLLLTLLITLFVTSGAGNDVKQEPEQPPLAADWLYTWGGLDSVSWCGSVPFYLDSCNDMEIDDEGDIWITGRTNVGDDYHPSEGEYWDCGYLSKFDSEGRLLWERYFGGFLGEGHGLGLFGNKCYVACELADNGAMTLADGSVIRGPDIYLVEFSSNGSAMWAKKLAEPVTRSGSNLWSAQDVAVDENGIIYVAGCFRGESDFDPGEGQSILVSGEWREYELYEAYVPGVYLTCYDSNGNFIRAQSWDTEESYSAPQMDIDGDGNVFLAGTFEGDVDMDPGPGVYPVKAVHLSDCYLLKLGADGEFKWARVWGGEGWQSLEDVAVDPMGRAVVIGRFSNSVKFDPSPAGEVITPEHPNTLYVSLFDGNGIHQWVRTFGGETPLVYGYAGATKVVADAESRIFVIGYSDLPVDLDPGEGEYIIRPEEDCRNVFIQVLDCNGSFLGATAYSSGDMSGISVTNLAFDRENDVVLSGVFTGTLRVELPDGVESIESTGYSEKNPWNSAGDCFLLEMPEPEEFGHAQCVAAEPVQPEEQETGIVGPDTLNERSLGYFGITVDDETAYSFAWSCEPEDAGEFTSPLQAGTGFIPSELIGINYAEATITVEITDSEGNEISYSKPLTIVGPTVNLAWRKTIEDFIPLDFAPLDDGEVYVCGVRQEPASMGMRVAPGTVMRLDGNGDELWRVWWECRQSTSEVIAAKIDSDSDSNVYVIGKMSAQVSLKPADIEYLEPTTDLGDRFHISKFDREGELVWKRIFKSNPLGSDWGFGDGFQQIQVDGDAVYVLGVFSYDVKCLMGEDERRVTIPAGRSLTRINSDGAIEWTARWGHDGFPSFWKPCMDIASDGSVFVSGNMSMDIELDPGAADGQTDEREWDPDVSPAGAYISHFSSSGNYLGSYSWPATDPGMTIYSMFVDPEDNIVILCSAGAGIDIDPGPGEFISPEIGDDIWGFGTTYYAAIDPESGLLWAIQDVGIYICEDPQGGWYSGVINWYGNSGLEQDDSTGTAIGSTIMVLQYDSTGEIIDTMSLSGECDMAQLLVLEASQDGSLYIGTDCESPTLAKIGG